MAMNVHELWLRVSTRSQGSRRLGDQPTRSSPEPPPSSTAS